MSKSPWTKSLRLTSSCFLLDINLPRSPPSKIRKKYTCFIKYRVLFIENINTFEQHYVCPCFEKAAKGESFWFFFFFLFPAIVSSDGVFRKKKKKKGQSREAESALLAQTRRHTGRKRFRRGGSARGGRQSVQLPVGSQSDTVRVKGSAETWTTSQCGPSNSQTSPTRETNVCVQVLFTKVDVLMLNAKRKCSSSGSTVQHFLHFVQTPCLDGWKLLKCARF